MQNRPLSVGIRFLKRRPDEGIKALAAMVVEELRQRQGLCEEEVREFYDEVLGQLFPEECAEAVAA